MRLLTTCFFLLSATVLSAGTITFSYNAQTGVNSVTVSDPSRMLVNVNGHNVQIFGPDAGSMEENFGLFQNVNMFASVAGQIGVQITRQYGATSANLFFLAAPETCQQVIPHPCSTDWGGGIDDPALSNPNHNALFSTITWDNPATYGTEVDTVSYQVLLTPEPATRVFVVIGLGLLALRRARNAGSRR